MIRGEEELIKELKQGSHSAFRELYEAYFDLLYGFVFNLTKSHHNATEIVQITFSKVWKYHAQVIPGVTFKAWLFKIGKNEVINTLKKQWKDPVFIDFMHYCDNENLKINPVESYDFEQFKHDLEEAKKELTNRQKLVFELYIEQGFSAKEIAKKLDINEQSVYNLLSKALSCIRSKLKYYHVTMFIIFFVSTPAFNQYMF